MYSKVIKWIKGKVEYKSVILFCMLSGVFALVTTANAQVYRWDNGEKISDTVPEPHADFSYQTLDYAALDGVNLEYASFFGTSLIYGHFMGSNLSNTTFFNRAVLTNANLSGADLTNADFPYNTLTDADMTGAIVNGTSFHGTTEFGFTASQLYSTASYQQKDLTGINLEKNDLSGWIFSAQNMEYARFEQATLTHTELDKANLSNAEFWKTDLTNANLSNANLSGAGLIQSDMTHANLSGANLTNTAFERSMLTEANLSGANCTSANFKGAVLTNVDMTGAIVKGASFLTVDGLTEAQLYSTTSYQNKELSEILFAGNDLNGWNLSNQDLSDSVFYYIEFFWMPQFAIAASLSNTDLSGADTRGAELQEDPIAAAGNIHNLIRPDGHIVGFDIGSSEDMLIRDYSGGIAIYVEDGMNVDPNGALQMRFEDPNWSSTISFESGINVTLDGTLELKIADGIEPVDLLETTFQLFD